jgi:glyceraldehyde 3-phosphate dehydrogenase
MATRIGINGFGRIGRLSFRTIRERYPDDIEVVAINDLTDAATNAFLLQHDSNYGRFPGSVASDETGIVVDGKRIRVTAEREPAAIPGTVRASISSSKPAASSRMPAARAATWSAASKGSSSAPRRKART